MTSPTPGKPVWWTRPSRILPIVGTVIVIVALLTPQRSEGRFGDSRLSSNLPGSLGAQLLAELSQRMGWRVMRETTEVVSPRKGAGVHAVLAPPLPITGEQAHGYLEAVRNGDGLLFVLDSRNPLSDSLGLTHFSSDGVLSSSADNQCGSNLREMMPALWPDGRAHLYSIRWLHGAKEGVVNFAPLVADRGGSNERETRPAGNGAVGFPLGRGRVVVVADPDLLRNDVLRYCRWGADVIAMHLLEWLRAGGEMPRNTLIFDEYHQGFGHRASMWEVVLPFLADHPVGRSLAALIAAGLMLLLAVAPRPILPVDVDRIERRDPLEQVDALSHAYHQVQATKTIVGRLVRGMRWRVQRVGAATRVASDADFLDAIARRHPALDHDVQHLRDALEHPVSDRELISIGQSLHRIEDTLTRTTS